MLMAQEEWRNIYLIVFSIKVYVYVFVCILFYLSLESLLGRISLNPVAAEPAFSHSFFPLSLHGSPLSAFLSLFCFPLQSRLFANSSICIWFKRALSSASVWLCSFSTCHSLTGYTFLVWDRILCLWLWVAAGLARPVSGVHPCVQGPRPMNCLEVL